MLDFRFLEELTSSSADTSTSSSDQLSDLFNKFLTTRNLIIVCAVIVGLVLIFYIFRRFVKVPANNVAVIVKNKQIEKLIDGNTTTKSVFLVPLVEKVGLMVNMNNNSFTSDKLEVNDGPDKLYKINFTMIYDVKDVKAFYEVNKSNLEEYFVKNINETLRLFVYEGNGETLLKNYMTNEAELVKLIDKALKVSGIKVKSFRVNTILKVN